jgi:hypothetical protein
VKDFSTIIFNVTPSPWSRPGSSHEALHARTHPRVVVDIPAKMVVVIWLRFGDVASQLSG